MRNTHSTNLLLPPQHYPKHTISHQCVVYRLESWVEIIG